MKIKKILNSSAYEINLGKPVDRISYIQKAVKGKNVLDLGCYDETAIHFKKNTDLWLHKSIYRVAKSVIGIDASTKIKSRIITSRKSYIVKGNVYNLDKIKINRNKIDIIIAGELIEHLSDTQVFIKNLSKIFPGKILLVTTPNATNITNAFLSYFKIELSHPDHVSIYSYMTLYNICRRLKIKKFSMIPYNLKYVELEHKSRGVKRFFVLLVRNIFNVFEYIFPAKAAGLILKIQL